MSSEQVDVEKSVSPLSRDVLVASSLNRSLMGTLDKFNLGLAAATVFCVTCLPSFGGSGLEEDSMEVLDSSVS